GVLAFGEATRQARRLCERLIERRLQRALVVLQQQELFPDERAFGLQFHNPFVGAIGVIDENLIGLAQRAAIGGLLRQLALEVGDLRTHRHDFAGELGLVTFEPARGLLRQRQFPAQLLAHAFQFRRPLFERAEFGAHALVAGAKLRQRVAQADIVGFLLFQRLQRGADGLDQVAEGVLEVVERADPTIGIDQQVAQRLVLLTDAGADVGQSRLARLFDAGWARLGGRWAPQTPLMWMHRLYAQENE